MSSLYSLNYPTILIESLTLTYTWRKGKCKQTAALNLKKLNQIFITMKTTSKRRTALVLVFLLKI